jgi:hypothetical protein
MRTIKGLLAGLLLGIGGTAMASEPVQLDAGQLDSVSAGVFSGTATAFTFEPFGIGNSIAFAELAQVATLSQTTLTPGAFQSNFTALAASNVIVQSAGVGLTATGGGGGVFTTVFPN